jgi:hypothetical protein
MEDYDGGFELEDLKRRIPTPYSLTLTQDERKAIDWIGGRYTHGDDLKAILLRCVPEEGCPEWEDKGDITFALREGAAWEVSEAIETDNLACFAPELCEKLWDFQEKIV